MQKMLLFLYCLRAIVSSRNPPFSLDDISCIIYTSLAGSPLDYIPWGDLFSFGDFPCMLLDVDYGFPSFVGDQIYCHFVCWAFIFQKDFESLVGL